MLRKGSLNGIHIGRRSGAKMDTCAHVYRVMGEAVAKAFSCGREIGH